MYLFHGKHLLTANIQKTVEQSNETPFFLSSFAQHTQSKTADQYKEANNTKIDSALVLIEQVKSDIQSEILAINTLVEVIGGHCEIELKVSGIFNMYFKY